MTTMVSTDAEYETDRKVEDIDDACTVFEINAMSNIAPQFHNKFNGQPRLWWKLETDVRGLVDDGRKFNIFAGSVFVEGQDVMKIGKRSEPRRNWKIGVPHGFFKIVIDVERSEAVGFLFDHSIDVEEGCSIENSRSKWPSACVVPIEKIEEATGLNFFGNLTQSKNDRLRSSSKESTWINWLND